LVVEGAHLEQAEVAAVSKEARRELRRWVEVDAMTQLG